MELACRVGWHFKATELRDDLTSLVPEETQDQVRAEILQILQKRLDEGDKNVILQLAQYHISVAVEADYKTLTLSSTCRGTERKKSIRVTK